MASDLSLIGSLVFCVAGVDAGFVEAVLEGTVVLPVCAEPVEVLISAVAGLLAAVGGFAASFSKAAVAAVVRLVVWEIGLSTGFAAAAGFTAVAVFIGAGFFATLPLPVEGLDMVVLV